MKRKILYTLAIVTITIAASVYIFNQFEAILILENSLQSRDDSIDNKDEELEIIMTDYDDLNEAYKLISEQLESTQREKEILKEEIDNLKFEVDDLDDYYTVSQDYSRTKAVSGFFRLINYYINAQYEKAQILSDPIYYYDRVDEKIIADYVEKVFDDEDTYTIEFDQYNSSAFFVVDDDQNVIWVSYYELNGRMHYWFTIQHAAVFDYKIETFIDLLQSKDLEGLSVHLSEIDIGPDIDDVASIVSLYEDVFDLKTIEIEFVRVDHLGFEYRLSGTKNSEKVEELIHVDIDDWAFIRDYKGREAWRNGE